MGDDQTSLSSLSSLTVEGQQDIESATLSQLFGTTVTYSFVMRNIQPGKNPLVPALFINKTKFQNCLYDCESDYLIPSGIKYFVKNGHLSRSGVVLLWMCVNHRFFLKHIHHPNYYKSTIQSQLAACKKLSEFRKLKHTGVVVASRRFLFNMRRAMPVKKKTQRAVMVKRVHSESG